LNYGPTNQKLIDRVKTSIEKFREENPDSLPMGSVQMATVNAHYNLDVPDMMFLTW
jgi:K+-transporting ATPase c subunit